MSLIDGKFSVESWDMEEEIQKEIDLNFIDPKSNFDYKSIIILELFELSEFEGLENNLRDLYQELDSKLIFNEAISSIKSKNPSRFSSLRLPEIRNSRYSIKSFSYGINKDLGKNFQYINIRLSRISYSNIVLEIHASLTGEVSKKMNEIIFKDYDDFVFKAKKNLMETYEFDLDRSKKTETIVDFQNNLKDELVQIISNFFSGYFLKLGRYRIPFIDVFYLNYPETEKDLIDWYEKHGNFIVTCFHTFFSSELTFQKSIFDEILLLFCKTHSYYSSDQVILGNRLKLHHMIDEDQDTDLFIQDNLLGNSFGLIAIQKRVQSETIILGELQSNIAREIDNINNLDLEKTLEFVKILSEKSYYFKTIKMELNSVDYTFIHSFKSLTEKKDFFKSIQEDTLDLIKNDETIIKILNENLRQVLDIKNIEYSKKSQESNYELNKNVSIFTIVIGALATIAAVIQIIIAILKP